MKKSAVTQELANNFASWTRVRQDDQSLGYRMLNAFANSMEHMEKQLGRMGANTFLPTANISEIDQLYRVVLPRDFEFEIDNQDPSNECPIAPDVLGLQDTVWYTVEQADQNDIQSFWYELAPDRVTVGTTIDSTSGSGDYTLINDTADNFPKTGSFLHHLQDGGKIVVEATGGTQYLKVDKQSVRRARVLLEGITRKGTQEEEVIVFPWDMKQTSTKEWKELTAVRLLDMEDAVTITVRSADFIHGPYLVPYNLRFSPQRNKIDEFWDVGLVDTVNTLDWIEYTSDEWQQLVLGFSDKGVRESWELLDSGNTNIAAVDIALEPFSERAWVIDNTMLYLFDTNQTIIENVEALRDRTQGTNLAFDLEFPSVVLGEDIVFIPIHARPLKEIQAYRIWYQTPTGDKFHFDATGTPQTFDNTFYIRDVFPLKRTVDSIKKVTSTERGEYILGFDAIYIDQEEDHERVVVPVQSKQAQAEFDLSSIGTNLTGIDFDTDHNLWVLDDNGDYHNIVMHYDKMLIDFVNKIIYFREQYENVDVTSNV